MPKLGIPIPDFCLAWDKRGWQASAMGHHICFFQSPGHWAKVLKRMDHAGHANQTGISGLMGTLPFHSCTFAK